MTFRHIIYLGEYARPKASERTRPYVLSHEIFLADDPSSPERTTIHGASLDHIAGYLDATLTTARGGDEVRAYNGFPQRLAQKCFKRRKINPLDKAGIQEIYELADLNEQWVPIESTR